MVYLKKYPHKSKNILSGDWIFVSPHRMKRAWLGKVDALNKDEFLSNMPVFNLLPGNKHSDRTINPAYENSFVLIINFSALINHTEDGEVSIDDLIIAKSETGIWRVISFSPHHFLMLCSAKKFMVGYKILANSQRYITAEVAAKMWRNLSANYFKIETSYA